MSLDVRTIVNVTTRIETGGVPRLAFGRGLLVTTDDALPAGGNSKAQLFTALSDVEDKFGISSDAYEAAAVWFAADPVPQGLYIGRWANVDVDTVLRGSEPDILSALTQADASFRLNGSDVTVNLSADTSYADVAAGIQTAIRSDVADASGWTFTYDSTNERFVLTLDDAGAIEGGAFEAHSMGSGTDISAALGLDAGSDPEYLLGSDAETISAGVDAMIDTSVGGEPVAVMLAGDVPDTYDHGGQTGLDTRDGLVVWSADADAVFALRETDDGLLTTGETTSKAAVALANSRGNVAAFYAAAGEYPDIGLMARMSSQNFDSPASIISPQGDTLPGVTAVSLTAAQFAELKRKRVNVYATVGGLPSFLGGYTSRAGYWLDAVWFLRWLESEVESAVWNTLRGARRFTRAQLYNALLGVMQRGVRAGGLQPGREVTAATKADIRSTTGNREFDGILTTGFLVWVDTVPSQFDRNSRIVRFKVWCVGSDAVHEVVGDIIFTN